MDINHFFLEKGNGEPLILLHGNGGNSGYFKKQIDEFSKHYHVYAIDTLRLGIAGKLVSMAEDAMKKEGIQKVLGLVFKDNDPANAFWEAWELGELTPEWWID